MPTPHVMKLFVLVGIVWAALVGPFTFAIILTHFGATNSQIGTLSAIAAIISMVFQPMWGMISDKTGSPRRVLCFCMVGSALFFGSVWFVGGLYIVAVLLLLDVVFRCGIVALLDSHTMAEVSTVPGLQYGHIRLAGSIFFGIFSLAYSGIINNWGIMAVVPISFGVIAFAIFWGLIVAKGKSDSIDVNEKRKKQTRTNLREDAIALFANRRYMVLIIFLACTALVSQPMWMFLIAFVTEVGGQYGDVPMIQALRCVVEIPLFIFVGTACKRVRSQRLMMVGVAFLLVYVILLMLANSLFMVAAAHLVGGTPGFIFLLTGRLRFLTEVTPDSVRSTSITLIGTVELGLGAIIGNAVAGRVIDMYGTQTLAAVCVVAVVAAGGVLLVLSRMKGEPTSSTVG